MLKYIHFIEYTVCKIEEKNDCYTSVVVTFLDFEEAYTIWVFAESLRREGEGQGPQG